MGKYVVFDIECRVDMFPSKGPFGGQKVDGANAYLLSFNHMTLEDKKASGLDLYQTKAFKKNFQNDKDLVEYAHKVLTDPEVEGYITFYGKGFDIPLLNTRFQYHGLSTLPPMPHDDIYDIFKSRKGKLALSSYSLDYLCKFYHLPEKTKVPNRDWILAAAGNIKSQKKIGEYGRNDVEITRKLYDKARGLNGAAMVVHPTTFNGDKPTNCIKCGHKHLKKSGKHKKATGWNQRYECLECRKYTQGKLLHRYE